MTSFGIVSEKQNLLLKIVPFQLYSLITQNEKVDQVLENQVRWLEELNKKVAFLRLNHLTDRVDTNFYAYSLFWNLANFLS